MYAWCVNFGVLINTDHRFIAMLSGFISKSSIGQYNIQESYNGSCRWKWHDWIRSILHVKADYHWKRRATENYVLVDVFCFRLSLMYKKNALIIWSMLKNHHTIHTSSQETYSYASIDLPLCQLKWYCSLNKLKSEAIKKNEQKMFFWTSKHLCQ